MRVPANLECEPPGFYPELGVRALVNIYLEKMQQDEAALTTIRELLSKKDQWYRSNEVVLESIKIRTITLANVFSFYPRNRSEDR